MKTVVLTGFSGAGKTSVGKVLQQNFGWSWLDLDDEIERQSGAPAGQIIRVEGEKYFRDLERKTLVNALERGVDVLSLGGGALLDSRNRELLKQSGYIIHLVVGPDEATKRVLADEESARSNRTGVVRPLLCSESLDPAVVRGKVSRLMLARAAVYETADIAINTEGKSVDELAMLVVKKRQSLT